MRKLAQDILGISSLKDDILTVINTEIASLKDEINKKLIDQASIYDQTQYLHTILIGWPMDSHTPQAELLSAPTGREVALRLLDSQRFRRGIREHLPLWPTHKWVCSEYRGLRFWVNLHDSYISMSILEESYEEPEVDFVLQHLAPGAVFVDVGANIGAFTLQAARVVGSAGRVFSFEPQPRVFEMLSRSIADNGFTDRCQAFQYGVSDVAGEAFIHIQEDLNQGFSHVSASEKAEHDSRISLTRLDDVDFGSRVDVFKIDVEGFETRVLRGGQAFFQKHRPIVLTEVFPWALRELGGSSPEEYVGLWEAYGYEVRHFENGRAERIIHPADMGAPEFQPIFLAVCMPN